MKTKSLKKFVETLNRSEGVSLIAIIALLVIMSVMGGVFSSVMGRWKISAPTTINSSKAIYLAEAAAMFALQDAKYRFFSKNASGNDMFNFGTNVSPYVVSTTTSSTEEADYWFEKPATDGDDGDDDDGDDDSDDDADDSDSGDDMDGDGYSDLYTIIATGKVKRDGTTVAKRQIKIKATITGSRSDPIDPGIHTSGDIVGTGGGFGMTNDGGTLSTSFGVGTNNNTGPDPEDGIVIRPAQPLDENFVKALAIDQGHYNAGDLTIGLANDNYPEPANPSFYFDSLTNILPNMTYIGQDLTVGSNRKAYGVIWVKGNVVLDGTATMDAIIICEGDITFNGNSDIVGGIIHYGSVINGNGNPNAITVNDSFFNALNATMPIITVVSSQEAVSAN